MALYQISGTVEIGYYLVLNDMRGHTEQQTPFGPYDTSEEALAFYDSQLAPEPWMDTIDQPVEQLDYPGKQFRKVFKKGSDLEWMNPLTSEERTQPGLFGHGVILVRQNLKITSQVKI